MKTFKNFKQLKTFAANLGESLDFINGSNFVKHDIMIDMEAIEKIYLEVKKSKCLTATCGYTETIYIGKNGTGRDINWRSDYTKVLEIKVRKNEFEVSISDFNK